MACLSQIEVCQRQFTRIIEGMSLLPYRQRLQHLRLTMLLKCRMRDDLIESFKIINGSVNYGHNNYVWEEYSLSNL